MNTNFYTLGLIRPGIEAGSSISIAADALSTRQLIGNLLFHDCYHKLFVLKSLPCAKNSLVNSVMKQ